MKFLILILFSLVSVLQGRAQTADFLITTNPEAVILYNTYQQRIPELRRRQFPSNTPWRILERSTFLSDQFTPVMRVEHDNDTYFIELDAGGEPRAMEGYPDPGYRFFRNCTIQTDTLQITQADKIALRDAAEGGDVITLLNRDMLLQTVFSYRNFLYVHTMERTIRYGWIKKSQSVFWEKVEAAKGMVTITLPQRLRDRIYQRIEETNELYTLYFSWMNERYEKSKPAPQWFLEDSDNAIVCRMNDAEYAEQLQESTRYLVQEIEGYLIGTPFRIVTENGTLYIQAK